MNKAEAIKLIESTFNATFSEDNFTYFIKNLLNDIDTTKYNEYHGQLIKDAFKDHIRQYKRIGKYIDPNGDALDVLIVEVKDHSKLDKARTSLRNFVITHLDNFEKDFALVAFYSKSDSGADWRFSFVKLEYRTEVKNGKIKQNKELTPAKRYSFLVGEHERAHTAKKQLLPLLQNVYNNPTIEQLEEAFSIETVTDEFFEQYKSLFIHLSEHFEKDNKLKNELATAGIDIPRFTKKLLGQIVFLYFLQKKGWLGVKKEEQWGTGDKKYLKSLFKKADENNKNYFGDYLQFLFYEALAHEHQDDGIKGFYKKLNCRIPFLNGGLFEADYDWQNDNISIPNSLFSNQIDIKKTGDIGTGVLDVFDRYNFTIKEDEPLEKEVAVDPEMLGKVFENMLEITERKSKGAFYTPREIVHYMCQESLIQYLDNSVNTYAKTFQEFGGQQTDMFGNKGKIGQHDIFTEKDHILVPKEDIEFFVRKGFFTLENDHRILREGKETKSYKFQLPETVRTHADLLDEKIVEIKICDPAIGSGAFPVGLLHELVNTQLVLKQHLTHKYLHKKIEKIGLAPTDLTIEKYSYRIKRYAIQESIYGVDIDASAIDIARLRLWLSLVVDEDDLDSIEALPNLDYKVVCGNSLIGFPEDWKSEAFSKLESLKTRFFEETDSEKKKELKNEINEQLKERLDTSKSIFGYKVDFDFKLFFSEVWHKKGGFDIVIGNPPYISISKVEYKDVLKKINYETFVTSGDLYILFYENSFRILKNKGNLNLITSNKWINASYGIKTRNFFINKTNTKILLDFAKVRIFPNATVFVNILILEKSIGNNMIQAAAIVGSKLPPVSLENYFNEQKVSLKIKPNEVWKIGSTKQLSINSRIEEVGSTIQSWAEIEFFRGITTGLNEAFHISNKKAEEIIKKDKECAKLIYPLLRGKDIKRWTYNYQNLSIIFTKQGTEIDKYPAIKEHLLNYYSELVPKQRKSDKTGRKPGSYKWFEIQDNTAYYRYFLKPKIIWIEISEKANYAYDDTGCFLTNSAYFISGENLKYLLSILNSSVADYYFFQLTAKIAGGRKRYTKQYVEQIPIPKISKDDQLPFEILVDYILLSKKTNNILLTSFFEDVLDAAVFDLFFEDKLKMAGKQILDHLNNLIPINDKISDEVNIGIVQSEFSRLYDPNHPVRNNTETIDSIEEVRIIYDALK